MKVKHQALVVLIIIVLIGALFNHSTINEFPSFIHAWTQSDKYALALGFVNNGLNFFKPETFTLLPTYPGKVFPALETITAVDFPINEYVAAIFMKITNNTSPIIFKLYILLYSFVGLFFIYKLSFLWTKNFYTSLFITILTATSPLFVYYQGGFLPTITSFANSFIALYFYSKYLKDPQNRFFNIAILFFTIATLTRTTFLIPLIAVLGVEFLRILRGESTLRPKLVTVLISFFLIAGYYLYNSFLRAEYGSIFLNHLFPAKNFEDAKEILLGAKEKWMNQIFSLPHYISMAILVLSLIGLAVFKKTASVTKLSVFSFLILIILIGESLFFVFMLKQFQAHDYYFLDSFYLPIICILIVIGSLIPLPTFKRSGIIYGILIFMITIPMITNAMKVQKTRRETGSWDKTMTLIKNFRDSEQFLDSQKIPKDAKILILYTNSPNIIPILLNRKSYPLMYLSKARIESALTWDFDYIVFQNENFQTDVYDHYPEILTRLRKIANNGKISICTLAEEPIDQTLAEFVSYYSDYPTFSAKMTYDKPASRLWKNIHTTSENAFSGTQAGKLDSNITYGLSFETKNLIELTQTNRTLVVSSYFLHESLDKCFLVVSMKENNESIYRKVSDLKDMLKVNNQWEKADFQFFLPQIKSDSYELSVYIWNAGKNNLLMDDFYVKIY